MNKREYIRLLKTSKWKKFSLEVKKRDGFKCVKCGDTKMLQSHHKLYIEGRKPWDYDLEDLETLCDTCHKNAHKGKKIADFVVKKDSVAKRIKKDRKQKTLLEQKRQKLISEGKLIPEKHFQIKLEKSESYYLEQIKKDRESKYKKKSKRKKR